MNKRAKQTNPMTQPMVRRVLVLGMLMIALCVFGCTSSKVADDIPFEYIVIDDQTWGIRCIGDIDGDGFADIVARAETGSGDHSLAWYEYPNWDQHVITDPESYRSCDIELADIDGDGDLDVIMVIDEPGKVYWYENPRPSGNPAGIWPSRYYIGLTYDGPDPDSYVKKVGNEGSNLSWWIGDAFGGKDRSQAEADGGDRWATNSLAYHDALCSLWLQTVPDCAGVQGRDDQKVHDGLLLYTQQSDR